MGCANSSVKTVQQSQNPPEKPPLPIEYLPEDKLEDAAEAARNEEAKARADAEEATRKAEEALAKRLHVESVSEKRKSMSPNRFPAKPQDEVVLENSLITRSSSTRVVEEAHLDNSLSAHNCPVEYRGEIDVVDSTSQQNSYAAEKVSAENISDSIVVDHVPMICHQVVTNEKTCNCCQLSFDETLGCNMLGDTCIVGKSRDGASLLATFSLLISRKEKEDQDIIHSMRSRIVPPKVDKEYLLPIAEETGLGVDVLQQFNDSHVKSKVDRTGEEYFTTLREKWSDISREGQVWDLGKWLIFFERSLFFYRTHNDIVPSTIFSK